MNKLMNNHRNYQICSNCVMDTTDSEISFDERGFVIIVRHFTLNPT